MTLPLELYKVIDGDKLTMADNSIEIMTINMNCRVELDSILKNLDVNLFPVEVFVLDLLSRV